jgi:hypothetical protein
MPRRSWRGSSIETRRELAQLTWAVLLIDAIAIGLGGLASRPMGPFAWKVGVGLAVFVTLCFAVLIAGNLVVESFANWWITRRESHGALRRPPNEH